MPPLPSSIKSVLYLSHYKPLPTQLASVTCRFVDFALGDEHPALHSLLTNFVVIDIFLPRNSPSTPEPPPNLALNALLR